MERLPAYVYLVFGLTLGLALFLFYRATSSSQRFVRLLTLWIIGQSALGLAHFYENTTGRLPRLPLLVGPPLVLIIALFATRRGQRFIGELSLARLALFHVVRVPVEVVLWWLFLHRTVPQLLTFEGRNFDILSGLTAPIVYYLGFVRRRLTRPVLLAWNLLGLGLVVNAVLNGVLSTPTRFQQFGFEQPNVAVLHFPFVLLPAVLVPLVLFAHLAAIRQLLLSLSIHSQQP